MTDTPARGTDVSTPVQTTHNPFGGLFDRVSHGARSAAHTISEKAQAVAEDPAVRQTVQNGARIAGNIGQGVVEGVKQDGQGMATDVHNGNYTGAAIRALPLLAGGPAGLIVKEVAPKVMAEGIKQLPPGTRHTLESSGAGRLALGAAEHGGIPTTSSLARIVLQSTRQAGTEAVLHGPHSAPVNQAGAADQPVKPSTVHSATQKYNSWLLPALQPTEKAKQ